MAQPVEGQFARIDETIDEVVLATRIVADTFLEVYKDIPERVANLLWALPSYEQFDAFREVG